MAFLIWLNMFRQAQAAWEDGERWPMILFWLCLFGMGAVPIGLLLLFGKGG